MATTVSGGIYEGPRGVFKDANGNPISAEQAAELQEKRRSLKESGVKSVRQAAPSDIQKAVAPVAPIEAPSSPVPDAPRKGTRKSAE